MCKSKLQGERRQIFDGDFRRKATNNCRTFKSIRKAPHVDKKEYCNFPFSTLNEGGNAGTPAIATDSGISCYSKVLYVDPTLGFF